MGKTRWGGYCPTSMSWNSYRLSKGLCTEWQHHLYNTWNNHGCEGYIPSNDKFMNFEYFVNWCKSQPWWGSFIANHQDYVFDKDILGTHTFAENTIVLTNLATNIRVGWRQNSNRNNTFNAVQANKRPVRVTEASGKVIEFDCVQACADYYAINQNYVSYYCNSHGRRGNVVYTSRSKVNGYKFEYI